MTPSKKCPSCGTVFYMESAYSWAKKTYCSKQCGYDALNDKRLKDRRKGIRREKIAKAKKSIPGRPMCYSDAAWELWILQDPVTDLCQRDKYRAESPCDVCSPEYRAKMRTMRKCEKYIHLY